MRDSGDPDSLVMKAPHSRQGTPPQGSLRLSWDLAAEPPSQLCGSQQSV